MQPRVILVVDDDQDILDVTSLVLGAEGYEVLTATDGAQALQLLQAGVRPDLILLDMMMPHMNGWEFRTAQLADRDIQHIPVVIVTGDGRAKEKAEQIGAQGWLGKPVGLGQLIAAIERFAAVAP
jgi:CheY-like chemotaxis protein